MLLEKNQYPLRASDVTTSLIFVGSHLDISKFSIVNNFLIYSPICMKFAPNSSVLEILLFWLGCTVSDPFPLT